MKSSARIRFGLFAAVALPLAAAAAAPALARAADRPPAPPAPPPEAYSACAGSAEGDACTVAFGEESAEGTCAVSREGNLFCRLDHPPPPPR